jgi:transcriptional/translational regulatory protein YebC/TACO1
MSVEDLILELIDFGVDEDVDDDGDELTIYGEFQSFNLFRNTWKKTNTKLKVGVHTHPHR